jgi:hypothetical protein
MDQATKPDNGYTLYKVVGYASPRSYVSAEPLIGKQLNTQRIALVTHTDGCLTKVNAD